MSQQLPDLGENQEICLVPRKICGKPFDTLLPVALVYTKESHRAVNGGQKGRMDKRRNKVLFCNEPPI